METFDRITSHPDFLEGTACIRGLRVPVMLVVNMVAAGLTAREIQQAFPGLDARDIEQALRYAATPAYEGITPGIDATA